MVAIGTPFSPSSTKLMLLGAGELGKELAIAAQRLGIEVIAVDKYEHAPAMQIAQRAHVIDLMNPSALQDVIQQEKPDYIVPEIEAINTRALCQLEKEGFNVVPCAQATLLTMDRIAVRQLAAEKLNLKTSGYVIADNLADFKQAVAKLGFPCIAKPVMSSSGKGQSAIVSEADIEAAWHHAQTEARGHAGTVIVEEYIDFDYEITLLTVRHRDGTSYCPPIGHEQEDGDYQVSWQPQPLPPEQLQQAQFIAKCITDELGGYGLFGVELFVKADTLYFNEVSPRPHDTGMVTLSAQNLSEFELHLRAILGLPIPAIELISPAASAVITAHGHSRNITYHHLEEALSHPRTSVRLFGKPAVKVKRRMGVVTTQAENVNLALMHARQAAAAIEVTLDNSTSTVTLSD